MAVLISKQDTDITTNEFYRVEAYQLGVYGNTLEALSTARQIPVTFANAGNCQGIVITLSTGISDIVLPFRDVTIELQEFVASVWTTRATETMTMAQIQGSSSPAGTWLVPFQFSTPYAVTTASNTWRFNVYSASWVATRHWSICKVNTGGTDANRYIYASWCDTQLTPSSGNDFIIFKNYVDITTSFTFKNYLGIAEATRSFCAWSCRNLDPDPDNVSYPRILNTIGSPVTIGLTGLFVLSTHWGFRAGTEANPHQADYCKIEFRNPTVGTFGSGFTDAGGFRQGGLSTNRCSMFFYGVSPTTAEKYATATTTCAVGGTTIGVDDPSVFVVNDFVMIGKRSANNSDEMGIPRHRITGISGNTLTFTPSLAVLPSRIGAKVIKTYNNATNATWYGVTLRRVGGTGAYQLFGGFGIMSNWIMSGCFLEMLYYSGLNNQGLVEDAAYNLGYQFTDCLILNSTALNGYGQGYESFILGGAMPISQVTFRRCIFTRQGSVNAFVYGNILSGNPAVSYAGGSLNHYDCIFMKIPTNTTLNGGIDFPNSAAILQDNDGIFIDGVGGGRSGLFLGGVKSRWDNIEVYGAAVGLGGNSAAIRVANFVSGTAKNIKINASLVGINFEGINANSTLTNVTFGDEYVNTWDITSNGKAFTDVVIKTVVGNPVINMTTVANTTLGTEIKFENVNAPNIDYVLQTYGEIYRTGTGLANTTVHTAGGYGLRFRPKSAIYPTYWEQNIPTGNIQNKTMTVGIWFKINNSAYWAWTHQMPRLTITYDNGASSAYTEATQTTDWQFITVSITPTTAFGQIIFRVDAKTDATTTNADFYVDDFTAPLPQGSELNLGSLDLFSDWLPVWPANFATSVSGADVWAANPALFGAGTVWALVKKIMKFILFLQ